jgi:hypothetical protein
MFFLFYEKFFTTSQTRGGGGRQGVKNLRIKYVPTFNPQNNFYKKNIFV